MNSRLQTSSVLLNAALKEIECNMKSNYVPAPNDHVSQVIQKCDKTFVSLQQRFVKPYSQEYIDSSNAAIDDDVKSGKLNIAIFDPQDLIHTFDKKEYLKVVAQMEYIFPRFSDRDPSVSLNKILTFKDTNSAILKILPYLLASYYFNLFGNRRIRPAISESFAENPDTKIIKTGTYSRDVTASCAMFSYHTFLGNFFSSGRSTHIRKIDAIKNESDLISYLTNKENINTKLSQVQVYKTFIYAVIAVACIEALDHTNFCVDYKSSWDLYDRHTCVSPTVTTLLALNNDAILSNKNKAITTLPPNEPDESAIYREALQSHLNLQVPTALFTETASFILNALNDIGLSIPEGFDCNKTNLHQYLAYYLRFLCSPFIYYYSDYPIVLQDLLGDNNKSFHMPYMTINSRAKRSKQKDSGSKMHSGADGQMGGNK